MVSLCGVKCVNTPGLAAFIVVAAAAAVSYFVFFLALERFQTRCSFSVSFLRKQAVHSSPHSTEGVGLFFCWLVLAVILCLLEATRRWIALGDSALPFSLLGHVRVTHSITEHRVDEGNGFTDHVSVGDRS